MIIKLIDWLCRRAKLIEYSNLKKHHDELSNSQNKQVDRNIKLFKQLKLYKKYSPIEHLYSLDDEPGKVYVWKLKPDIEDYAYTENINKSLNEKGKELKAIHIFTSQLDKIKHLEKDEVQILLEHYYSEDARKGGRK